MSSPTPAPRSYSFKFGPLLVWLLALRRVQVLPAGLRYRRWWSVQEIDFAGITRMDVRHHVSVFEGIEPGAGPGSEWWLDLTTSGSTKPVSLPLHNLHWLDVAVLVTVLSANAKAAQATPEFLELAQAIRGDEWLRER